MTTEIDYLLESRASLAEKTKTNYANYYKRLRPLLNQDINDTSEEKIIEAIDSGREEDRKTKELVDIPQSVKQSLLNVAICIKQVFNKPIGELIRFRTDGIKKSVSANAVKNIELKEQLPSVKEMVDFMNDRYERGDYTSYIINYLILTFNTRNADLNLIITTDGKALKEGTNWLVLRKDSVRCVRYDFKTKDTYNCLENIIKSAKFINSVKELLGDKTETPLLLTEDGNKITESSLSKYISRRTLNEIGQGKMLKAILADKNDLKTLEKISSNRGTAITTLAENYAPTFTDQVGKMAEKTKKSKCLSKVSVKGAEKKATKKKTKAEEIAVAVAQQNEGTESD